MRMRTAATALNFALHRGNKMQMRCCFIVGEVMRMSVSRKHNEKMYRPIGWNYHGRLPPHQ